MDIKDFLTIIVVSTLILFGFLFLINKPIILIFLWEEKDARGLLLFLVIVSIIFNINNLETLGIHVTQIDMLKYILLSFVISSLYFIFFDFMSLYKNYFISKKKTNVEIIGSAIFFLIFFVILLLPFLQIVGEILLDSNFAGIFIFLTPFVVALMVAFYKGDSKFVKFVKGEKE